MLTICYTTGTPCYASAICYIHIHLYTHIHTGRGTETEQQIQTRLKNAHIELAYGTSENFEKILINHNLNQARNEFVDTVAEWFPHILS